MNRSYQFNDADRPGVNHSGSNRPGATWKKDVLASLVVFLVALPLCMGIAIASGAPPMTGILSGIIGGLVVAVLGGSPLQVSGPANSLIVVVGMIIADYGLVVLGAVVAAAGILQILAGTFRLGQWFRAVPPATILGLMTGFAIIIFASQFHVMLDDQPRATPLENLLSIPQALWDAAFLKDGSHKAAGIGVLTITVLLLWKRVAPKPLTGIPASLVAVVAGAVAAQFVSVNRVQIESFAALSLLDPQAFLLLGDWRVLELTLTIAFLASTESLLSATAIDQLHKGHRTQYDRELVAQGVGNVACGLLGALPLTGVIIRGAANVGAGAQTRLSSVLHGFWILVIVAFAPGILMMVPLASLAAILVVAVFRLVNPTALRLMWQKDKFDLAVYGITAATIVAAGALPGVVVGLLLCMAKLLYTFTRLEVRLERDPMQPCAQLHLRGAATFLRLPTLANALEQVPKDVDLHVHVEELTFIDHACLEFIRNWSGQQASGGGVVINWNALTSRAVVQSTRSQVPQPEESLVA